jgi:hypothetical protein
MDKSRAIQFHYRNWKGLEALRTVTPIDLLDGDTHHGKKWVLKAYCHDKEAIRNFDMTSILSGITPYTPEPVRTHIVYCTQYLATGSMRMLFVTGLNDAEHPPLTEFITQAKLFTKDEANEVREAYEMARYIETVSQYHIYSPVEDKASA